MFAIFPSLMRNLVSKPAVSGRSRFLGGKRRIKVKESICIDTENCTFCGICGKTCVSGAIRLNKIDRIISIDHLGCILCGLCEDECPKNCITIM